MLSVRLGIVPILIYIYIRSSRIYIFLKFLTIPPEIGRYFTGEETRSLSDYVTDWQLESKLVDKNWTTALLNCCWALSPPNVFWFESQDNGEQVN